MATLAEPHLVPAPRNWAIVPTAAWAAPIGRFLFSLIFIASGLRHFSSDIINYGASAGVPMANILVPAAGIIAMIGGLSILTGFHARIGALLLIVFLVPVTLTMHAFWAVTDPMMAQMQMAMFMKNVSMLGAAIYFFCVGSGPFSMDHGKYRF
ncbi:MAG: DoxX family protein [Bacteriovoracaceae bacterium]